MAIALPIAPVAPVTAATRLDEEEFNIKSPEAINKSSLTQGYNRVNVYAFLRIAQGVKGIIEDNNSDIKSQ